MKVLYSPEAVERLGEIKKNWGKKTYQSIRNAVSGLENGPENGASVEAYLGIPNPYRMLHLAQHYVFYRIDVESEIIRITHIFNEREEFLQTLFGISLRTQESIDYWGE